jgi:hypothetical protein
MVVLPVVLQILHPMEQMIDKTVAVVLQILHQMKHFFLSVAFVVVLQTL